METLLVGLPAALLAFLLLVVALPLARARHRTGKWAWVVRPSSGPVERFVRGWLGLWLALTASWIGLVAIVGTKPMGIYEPPAAITWLGLAVIAAGCGIVMVAQHQMGASWRIGIDDAPTPLVTHGLFRFVRHPIYMGVMLAESGLVLAAPSAFSVCAWLLLYLLVGIQSRLEDEHMELQHGDAFRQWAARVSRLLPGLEHLRKTEQGPA